MGLSLSGHCQGFSPGTFLSSFKDLVPVDEVYRHLIFKGVTSRVVPGRHASLNYVSLICIKIVRVTSGLSQHPIRRLIIRCPSLRPVRSRGKMLTLLWILAGASPCGQITCQISEQLESETSILHIQNFARSYCSCLMHIWTAFRHFSILSLKGINHCVSHLGTDSI